MSGEGRQKPSSYSELASVIERLPIIVKERRRASGLSQRAAGVEAGVPFNTISRVERGEAASQTSLLALLQWLDQRR